MKHPFPRRAIAALLSATLALAVPLSASLAATTTGTFTVTATVGNSCNVSAANVAFGAVTAGAAATNVANTITLTCNHKATVSSVALNNGANASGTQKRMSDGTDTLDYLDRCSHRRHVQHLPCSGRGARVECHKHHRGDLVVRGERRSEADQHLRVDTGWPVPGSRQLHRHGHGHRHVRLSSRQA